MLPLIRHPRAFPLFLSALLIAGGCESGLERIDRRTTALLHEASRTLGEEAPPPQSRPMLTPERVANTSLDFEDQRPSTVNPPVESLTWTPQATDAADSVIARLEAYNAVSADATSLNLNQALVYATENSREFRTAEEEYVLAALRLLLERHLWGPRFFDDVSVFADSRGFNDTFDSALRVVNDFRVTQRLPYGGDISIRALAQATEDLHQRVSGEAVQSADIILEANVPLLRGAGLAARETRILAERGLIYAARDFERFRRQFLVAIATDFLSLVAAQQGIANAIRQLESFEALERRALALVKSGREDPFQAALAAQDTLFARDSLTSQQEQYRLAIDRFKVRIGMPTEQPLVIVASDIGLSPPKVNLDDAVRAAMAYRLDLQTSVDRVDDERRAIAVARNQLLPDLNLSGNVSLPTDTDRSDERAGVDFDPGDADATVGLTFGLPLDRELERLRLRQAQIDLERTQRSYEQDRDEIAVEVRAAARDIDRAIFSLQLQEENIRIALRRQASIDAAPDRANARDRSDAVEALLRAEDDRDRARRDLQVSILRYLLATDQLRVDRDGIILPLPGMAIS